MSLAAPQETARLWFTTFPAPARWTTQGRFEPWTWVEVVHHVRTPELWPGAPAITASEEQLPGWTFARYADDCRVASDDPAIADRQTASRVREVWGLAVEYDDEPAADIEHLRQWWGQWRYVAYTTAFHQQQMGEKPPGPRWRLLIPFTRAASLEEATRVGAWARSPHREAGIVDRATERPWRYYAVPAVIPGGYRWDLHDGEILDPDRVLEQLDRWEAEDATSSARRALERTAIGEVARQWLQGFVDPAGDFAPGFEEPQAPPGALLPAAEASGRIWPHLATLIGGTWPGRVGTVVGPVGSGRTSFVLQAAEWVARGRNPVLLALRGASEQEVLARLLVLRARAPVPYASVLARSVPRVDAEISALRLAADCPFLYLWSGATGARTPDALCLAARAVSHSYDGAAPLVVIDSVPLPRDAPEWWDALLDVARPGGLDPGWPGARVLVVSPLPRAASPAFGRPNDLAAWCERALHRATALEELDQSLAEAADAAGLLLGLTVDPSPGKGQRDALVAVLANRHGVRGNVRFRYAPGQGIWTEQDAEETHEPPRIAEHPTLLLTGPPAPVTSDEGG